MHERELGQPVAMSVVLREFLHWLYPTRFPTPAEYWPRIMRAIEALDSWEARIPCTTLRPSAANCAELSQWAAYRGDPAHLTNLSAIIVDLPPGSGHGPQVSDNLRLWGSTVGAILPAIDQPSVSVAQTGSHQDSHRQGKGSTLGPGH